MEIGGQPKGCCCCCCYQTNTKGSTQEGLQGHQRQGEKITIGQPIALFSCQTYCLYKLALFSLFSLFTFYLFGSVLDFTVSRFLCVLSLATFAFSFALYQQIKNPLLPKQKNGRPTALLLPEEVLHHDRHHHSDHPDGHPRHPGRRGHRRRGHPATGREGQRACGKFQVVFKKDFLNQTFQTKLKLNQIT